VDPLSGKFDWISLSPKRHKPPCNQLLSCCDELKLVVHEAADLEFAESMAAANIAAANQKSAALLLQPGADCPEGRDLAINYVLKHPNWRLSLQTHKWLGVR
jgi:organic radical activating enzyme